MKIGCVGVSSTPAPFYLFPLGLRPLGPSFAMRSFSSSLLLALSLPFYAMAYRNRPRTGHDSGPALHARARGHVLQKRISGGRMTYYDIAVGNSEYVSLTLPVLFQV